MELNLSNVSRRGRDGLTERHWINSSLSRLQHRFRRELRTVGRTYLPTQSLDPQDRRRNLLHWWAAGNAARGSPTIARASLDARDRLVSRGGPVSSAHDEPRR